jgi:predicted transcriptional regulator
MYIGNIKGIAHMYTGEIATLFIKRSTEAKLTRDGLKFSKDVFDEICEATTGVKPTIFRRTPFDVVEKIKAAEKIALRIIEKRNNEEIIRIAELPSVYDSEAHYRDAHDFYSTNSTSGEY